MYTLLYTPPTPKIKIHIIMEKTPTDLMWDLLAPSPIFENTKKSFRTFFCSLTVARQRQIYYTIREQKKRGVAIKENPLFAIQDCDPHPTNWNGRMGAEEMFKTTKMVSAKCGERYGVYTAQEAQIFELKDVKPLN